MTSPAPDLFAWAAEEEQKASPAWLPTKAQRVTARHRDYERMEPVAITLASRSGANGFTADDLRAAAIDAGILTGKEGKGKHSDQQRTLSWLGPFLMSLARQGKIIARTHADGSKVRRPSARPEANANLQVVYTTLK